jgi:hypothetical protein
VKVEGRAADLSVRSETGGVPLDSAAMAITLTGQGYAAGPGRSATFTFSIWGLHWRGGLPSAGDLLIAVFSRPAGEMIVGSPSWSRAAPSIFFLPNWWPQDDFHTFTASEASLEWEAQLFGVSGMTLAAEGDPVLQGQSGPGFWECADCMRIGGYYVYICLKHRLLPAPAGSGSGTPAYTPPEGHVAVIS